MMMDTSIIDKESPEYYRQELANFSYKVSHDLQAPLRSVIGFSNLVRISAADRLMPQEKEDMDMVLDCAKHMQQLIEALLHYSRLITTPHLLLRTDAEAVLKEVLHHMEENITAEDATITHDTLPYVMADPMELQLLLEYLISNALKFHKKGEPPIIRITVEPYEKRNYWLFRVIDNGIGIDSKYHHTIFDMFKKLHSDAEYPGLGIGLTFSQKIIEHHHGTIGVDSFPGQGTTLWFTLQAG